MAQRKRREQIQTNKSQYPQASLSTGPHPRLSHDPDSQSPSANLCSIIDSPGEKITLDFFSNQIRGVAE